MVVGYDVCAAEFEQAFDGFADDHRAQVPDMHLLCGVGGRVVDDGFAPAVELLCGGAQFGFAAVFGEPLAEEFFRQLEVHKPGAGNRRFDKLFVELGRRLNRREELFARRARIFPAGFCVLERAVCLKVAELGVGGADYGVEVGVESRRLGCVFSKSRNGFCWVKPNFHFKKYG